MAQLFFLDSLMSKINIPKYFNFVNISWIIVLKFWSKVKKMLNKRIKELRLAQGYSQVALAERLGVSKQAVSNWENDNIQPSIEMLLRLADLFCVTTDYLLGREDCLRVDISGLDPKTAGHVALLIDDIRRK